jgi:hypothetical protein
MLVYDTISQIFSKISKTSYNIRENNLKSSNKHCKKNKKHSRKQVSFYEPSFFLVKVFVQMKILKLGNPYAYLWYLLGESGCTGIILYFKINSSIDQLIFNLFYTAWLYGWRLTIPISIIHAWICIKAYEVF